MELRSMSLARHRTCKLLEQAAPVISEDEDSPLTSSPSESQLSIDLSDSCSRSERHTSVDSGFQLSPQFFTPDTHPTHDLPISLLQKGWRKIWSKRENRLYYFNKFSGDSVWEQPIIEVIFLCL